MAENNMQIILEMIDKASPEFKKVNAETIKQVKLLEGETKKASKEIDEGFRVAGKQLRDFRAQLLPVVAIIGSLVISTKEWSKSNKETRDAFTSLGESVRTLSASVGSILAPSIIGLSLAIKESTGFLLEYFDRLKEGYTALFEKISFGTQFVVAFFTAFKEGVGITEANSIAFGVATKASKEMTEQFREGMEDVIISNEYVAKSYQDLNSLIEQVGDERVLRDRAILDEQIASLKYYEQTYRTAHQGMAAFTVTIGKTIQSGLSNALAGIASGVTTAREAFKQLGQAMIAAIVGFIAQKLIAAALEKTLLAGTVAASSAAASAVAAAWAIPAAMVSLATFGANAVPAAAGIASVTTLAAGLAIANKAQSVANAANLAGEISAPATGIAVGTFGGFQAEGGDYLVNKPTMFIAGERGPERATFTPVGRDGSSKFGDINIFIQGGINSAGMSVDKMAEQLGFAFEREVRTARGF